MTLESNSDAPELLALRAEMDHDPRAARKRVFSRLEQSVPGLAAATATSLVASEIAAKAPQAAAPLGLPAKLWLLGAFTLGGAAGAVTYATLEASPSPRVVFVDRFVAAPSSAPARVEPLAPPGEVPSVANGVVAEPVRTKRASSTQPTRALDEPKPEVPSSPEPPAESSTSSASLAEQQALLDQARAALGRDDGRTALETLGRHATRFPESVLAEEREALTVKALVKLGNVTEARARLDAFERRFPRSPLLPSLRNALGDSVTETKRKGQ